MRLEGDISGALISDESIRQTLPAIFVDSMVVDQNFNIVVISQNVLEFLEFNVEEVKYKSINYLAGSCDLVSILKNDLAQGYLKKGKLRCSARATEESLWGSLDSTLD
jgi:hypothetical protein